MQGYGAYPGPFGAEGVEPPPPEDTRQQQDDIHALKEKYVGDTAGAGCEEPLYFNLVPGTAVKFDEPETVTNGFIISVDSGTAKCWTSDRTSTPNAKAQYTVPSGSAPAQYLFETRKGRVYTVANDTTSAVNAVGCLTVVRV